MASAKKAKRAKTDPTEKFEEMFEELYSVTTGAKSSRNAYGLLDNATRRHKAFFKRNPDLKGEFDAYCERRREEARALDRKHADEMRPIIDADKAEADFRAVHKRGMSIHEVKVFVTALCTKYTYDGAADSELAQRSRKVRGLLMELGALEVAFDHCVAQYELAQCFSTRLSSAFVVHVSTENTDKLVKRLDEAGFQASKIFISAYEVPTGTLLRLRRK